MKNIILLFSLWILPFVKNSNSVLTFLNDEIIFTDFDDFDCDGLTNKEEKILGSNPTEVDTDNDGLPDNWETPGHGFPQLDALHVSPRHADLIIYFRWRPEITRAMVENWVAGVNHVGVIDFFRNLYVSNPDGKSGINVIPIYGGALPSGETKTGRDLLPAYFPNEWKGIAHWHELYHGGAGQSPVLSINGSSGSEGDWRSIIHEMGHQLGLSHAGFADDRTHPRNPLYSSLMNYDYSYSLNDDANRINYSYGVFSHVTLNENHISEFLPGYSPEQLGFLTHSPYHYKIKNSTVPNGTFIDWNRDGVFGANNIRCDINMMGWIEPTEYYDKEIINKISLGNVCAVGGYSSLYFLYPGDETIPIHKAREFSNLSENPAFLFIWKKGGKNVIKLTDKVVTGNISAVINNSRLYVTAPYNGGILLSEYALSGIDGGISVGSRPISIHSKFIPQEKIYTSQLVIVKNEVYLFTWCNNDVNGNKISYRQYTDLGELKPEKFLAENSQSDIGVCWNPETNKLCLVRTIKGNRPNRLQMVSYSYNETAKEFVASQLSLMGLESAETRTWSRPSVVYTKLNASLPGKIYAFYQGDSSPSIYCSRQVGDVSYQNGWEEVSLGGDNSLSVVSATNYNNDIVVSCRSAEESVMSQIRVLYNGTGIEKYDMLDFNDVDYIRKTGLKKSLENNR